MDKDLNEVTKINSRNSSTHSKITSTPNVTKVLRKDLWYNDKIDTVDIFPGLSQKHLLPSTLLLKLMGSEITKSELV